MEKLKVDKAKLIKVLVQNKDQHVADYKIALDGYRVSLKKAISKKSKELKESSDEDLEKFNFYLNVVKPENHVKDFETVIGWLNWSIESEVAISENEYKQYFLNEWSWKNDWYFSNSANIGAGKAYVNAKKIK
jgi:hypothetical protein